MGRRTIRGHIDRRGGLIALSSCPALSGSILPGIPRCSKPPGGDRFARLRSREKLSRPARPLRIPPSMVEQLDWAVGDFIVEGWITTYDATAATL